MSYVLSDTEYREFRELLAWKKRFQIVGAIKQQDGVYQLPPPPPSAPPPAAAAPLLFLTPTATLAGTGIYTVRRVALPTADIDPTAHLSISMWGAIDTVDAIGLNLAEQAYADGRHDLTLNSRVWECRFLRVNASGLTVYTFNASEDEDCT